MSDNIFYDGTKLLSLKDINGETPEIYICTTNRSAGKTTYFNRLAVRRFKERKEKFAILYRFNYELDGVAEKFFKDIKPLFFPNDNMTSKRMAAGVFHELYLNDEPCGYGITINSADQLKKYSHFFSDVKMIIFDEFQSESNHYCSNEVQKFISIHTTIARGQGEQVRYVPVYMLSNTVTLLNPYYSEMCISSRLTAQVNFLRGEGWVLEQGYNEGASKAQKGSGFNRAFKNSKYVAYSSENVYLNDNMAFIEKPVGSGKYVCSFSFNGKWFAIRSYADEGLLYCSQKVDMSFKYKFSGLVQDHDINQVLLQRHGNFFMQLRNIFEKGQFRFSDLESKEAILTTLAYIPSSISVYT